MEKNIDEDPKALEEMISRDVRGLPSFLVGDDLVIGLDKARIMELVDHRLLECTQCGQKMRVPIKKGQVIVTCPKCNTRFAFDPKDSGVYV